MALGNRFWQNLRFIPLVLVLLCANSETRQLVTVTLQHLLNCPSCSLEATVPNPTPSLSLLTLETSSGVVTKTSALVQTIAFLYLLLLGWGMFFPAPFARSHKSRAPPAKVWA